MGIIWVIVEGPPLGLRPRVSPHGPLRGPREAPPATHLDTLSHPLLAQGVSSSCLGVCPLGIAFGSPLGTPTPPIGVFRRASSKPPHALPTHPR